MEGGRWGRVVDRGGSGGATRVLRPAPPRSPHLPAARTRTQKGGGLHVKYALCAFCAHSEQEGERAREGRGTAQGDRKKEGGVFYHPPSRVAPREQRPPPRHGPGIEPIAKKEKRKRCRFFLGGVSLKRKERQRVGWCAPLDSSPRPKAIATQRASHASARKCEDSVVSPHHRASRTPHAGQRPGRGGQRSEREGWKNRTHTHTQKPAHADASRRRPPDATPADCTVSSSDGAGAAAAAATAFALAPAASHALPIASRDR